MASLECVYPDQVREKLSGKTVLIIGSSKGGQQYIWDIFSRAQIKVVLVGHGSSNHGEGQVETFINYDYYQDKSDIRKHARNIIQLLGDRVKEVDGCLTFNEEVLPITAAICENLKLRGLNPNDAIVSSIKQKTYEALRSATNITTLKTEKYSPVSYHILKENDITEAKQIIYPAILKPEGTTNSWGVVKVMSENDCFLKYNQIQDLYRASSVEHSYGTSMILMELLEGLSYEVDVVIYDGELMAAFVTDVGLYLPNSYACTSVCTPSNLSAELRAQLMTAAHHCCCKVGLINGVFNSEFKMTKTGPKLVEINGRVGCFRRCIVYETTHGVNLWEIAAAIACGIKPCFPEITPRCFAVGGFLFRKFHEKQFLEEDVCLKLKDMVEAKDILLVMQPTKKEQHLEAETFLSPFCHLVALNKTSKKCARQTLIQLFQDLGFNGTDYDVERFTNVWA